MNRTLLVVLSAFVLAACAERSTVTPAASPGSPGASLAGRSFEAAGITADGRARPLVRGTTLEVTFAPDGTVGFQAGCNRFSAPVTIAPDRLIIGRLTTTDMACAGPLTKQDEWLAAFFGAGPGWRREGADVLLTRGTTTIRLAEPEPTPADALVGTEWVVYARIAGGGETGTTPGVEATLTFDGTTVTGSTGCAEIDTPARVGPGTIRIGAVEQNRVVPCASGTNEVHRAVTDVVREGATLTYERDGDTLRMMSGDRGLLLRPR